MTDRPADRLRMLRDNLAAEAQKARQNELAGRALWYANFANTNGITVPQPPPEPEVRLARLEAADRHGLTVEQADAMTGTTPDAIEAEAQALAPPGEGGARTDQPWPASDPQGNHAIRQAISEAEARGEDTFRLKLQLTANNMLNPKG